MYVGCVSGAIPKAQYLEKIKEAGFAEIVICKENRLSFPMKFLKGILAKTKWVLSKQLTGVRLFL